MNGDKGERRRRLNSRTNAYNLLIGSAVILIVAGGAIFLTPHDYPAGDPRNEPIFWIVVGVIALLFAGVSVVAALRTLLRPPTPGDEDDNRPAASS